MVRILASVKDHYNIEYCLCYYTFYDLFFFFFLFIILRRYGFLIYKFTNSTMNINSCNAFFTEIITKPREYKYLWYNINYQNLLKEELKKRWRPDLIDVNLFFKNVDRE